MWKEVEMEFDMWRGGLFFLYSELNVLQRLRKRLFGIFSKDTIWIQFWPTFSGGKIGEKQQEGEVKGRRHSAQQLHA